LKKRLAAAFLEAEKTRDIKNKEAGSRHHLKEAHYAEHDPRFVKKRGFYPHQAAFADGKKDAPGFYGVSACCG
jgi:hypothetical protein